ncbi:spore cortex biosynthesis protein YabQ [Bacillus songklensis]|uniref:Spore cortex biosynthesis protein YabQ n=1 Tax=Bacillus songklensis TaxID=1069116 RepID=A0ABV8AVR0_9BACI
MTLTTQFYTILSMIAMGSYLGAALDTYQFFLNRPKRAGWIVFINDVLFWALQALLFFYVLFYVNEGELRLYAFLAILCGFAAYQSLFKTVYMRLLKMIINMIVLTYGFVVRLIQLLIVKPVLLVSRLLVMILLFVYKSLLALLKITWKIVWAPIRWIGMIIWRMMPKNVKSFLHSSFKYVEGFYKKIKNTKQRIKAWIDYFKKKEDK